MTTDEMIEVMARVIYEADDPWHTAWPWPDLQSDQAGVDQYRRIARAALAAILPVMREKVERAHMTAAYDPAPYTKGRAAISALFDQIAADVGL